MKGLRGGRKVPLKGQCRQGRRVAPVDGQESAGGQAHRRRCRHAGRPRHLVPRGNGRTRRTAKPEEMNAEDPLFILYTSGSTGSPRACCTPPAATCLRRDDAPICLRLSRRRHLLVHRRCGLGHRPQLHRLRPAGQRRDHADVRGRADLSGSPPASGTWSTSTRSTSSTPRPPPSAR
jgi:hypothetical protein